MHINIMESYIITLHVIQGEQTGAKGEQVSLVHDAWDHLVIATLILHNCYIVCLIGVSMNSNITVHVTCVLEHVYYTCRNTP